MLVMRIMPLTRIFISETYWSSESKGGSPLLSLSVLGVPSGLRQKA